MKYKKEETVTSIMLPATVFQQKLEFLLQSVINCLADGGSDEWLINTHRNDSLMVLQKRAYIKEGSTSNTFDEGGGIQQQAKQLIRLKTSE